MVEVRKAEAILNEAFGRAAPLTVATRAIVRSVALTAIRQAQREAIEAAAKVAERQTKDTGATAQAYNYARRDAAAAIRATLPETRDGE